MNITSNYIYNQYNTPKFLSKRHSPFKCNKNQIAFTGKAINPTEGIKKAKEVSGFIKTIAKPIELICSAKLTQKIAKWSEGKTFGKPNTDLLQKIGLLGVSVLLDGLYITRTLKSKDIEKDRKKTLAVNQGITMVCSFIGALVVDDALFNTVGKIKKQFAEVNKGMNPDKIKNIQGGIGLLNKCLIIALIYRFIAPVIATPMADKLSKFMKKHGWMKDDK